ncbi:MULTISPECIES: fimbrial protein [unclassified Pseudomonas]|uniref:fimbrial protein n=1 Tax=unclassified Pseudomonas TaxID=196821 RepID=UPI0014755C18|nr:MULTISPECIES: fimbrial protein [unclassified Pseudomonas]NMY39626.1 fimbrial protein [Pseudomonas sp. WS 5078]NMY62350.1 fimbrial protein [Pseudomonas sp. WS 5354]
MKICKQLALLVLCTAGINAAASANLAFTGTLVEPPLCTINNGNTLTIDFKDVGVNKVDGINYRLPMNYTITCAGSTLPWEMVLTVKGTASSFESAAVQSSVTDLGIKLLQNGQPFQLNTPIVINPATPPALEAVPVKRPGSTLKSGGFSAAATLMAEYQ